LKLTYKLYCPKLTGEIYHSEEFLFIIYYIKLPELDMPVQERWTWLPC